MSKPIESAELHVYLINPHCEWVIAKSPQQALEIWADQADAEPEDDPPDAVQLHDDELFTYSDDGGDTSEEKTCAEWAARYGIGWFAREL